MAQRRATTIKEVARAAGVSVQTVSRVINGRPDVAPATRERVQAVIKAAGFQPSAAARSLVSRRSNTLGVITAGLKYFGVAQTLNGVTEESESNGYGLLLKVVPVFGDTDLDPVIEFMLGHRVEGIIFAGLDQARLMPPIRPSLVPPVVFLKTQPEFAAPAIVVDNFGGAQHATAHLLSLGRRRIGHIAGPTSSPDSRAREEGWRQALRTGGAEIGGLERGDWSAMSGADAFDRLMAHAPYTDAVFVANDQMALGLLRRAYERRVAIPGDVAVVGFDNLEEGAHSIPSLTTVDQPLHRLGQLGVQMVLGIMLGDRLRELTPSTTILATTLVVRESAPIA